MNGVASLMTAQMRAAFRRHLTIIALVAVAIGFAVFAINYAVLALQMWLIGVYGSAIEADLTIAGGLAIVGISFALAAYVKRRAKPPSNSLPIAIALAAPVAAKLAPRLLNAKLLGAAAVLIGGIIVGRELRKDS